MDSLINTLFYFYVFTHVVASTIGIVTFIWRRSTWTREFSSRASHPLFWLLIFIIYPYMMVKKTLAQLR